jgi:integrase
MYVPNSDMVKKFVYRIGSEHLRAMIIVSIETAASASEVFNLQWKDVNLSQKTLITGCEGHGTKSARLSFFIFFFQFD